MFSLSDLTTLGNLERSHIFTNVKLSTLHSYFSSVRIKSIGTIQTPSQVG